MILGIIAARSTSHRLPGKSNMKIGDKTLVEHCVEGCLASKSVDRWILATPYNDAICYPCDGKNIIQLKPNCDEDDVLKRYVISVEHSEKLYGISVQWIVRITADCWDIKPDLIDKCVQWCKWSDLPIFYSYIEGSTVEVFSREDLIRADKECVSYDDRQHVTSRFDHGWDKGSVDTIEELENARNQYENRKKNENIL